MAAFADLPAGNGTAHIDLADEAATRTLGRAIARALRPGDCLALSGDLGVGKTALARAIIQAAMGDACPVPSPTFTLVQRYETPGLTIWHFDLYRLGHADELLELGWDEASGDAAIVEWAERAGPYLPETAVTCALCFGEGESARIAELTGPAGWLDRLDHATKRE